MAKHHFTKSWIESIESTDRLQSFTDDQVRGLTLKVTPNGVKTFYLVKRFEGNLESTKLGRFPETTLKIARERAAKLHLQYDAGVNPAEEKRRERSELTLDAFFKIYHRDHCRLRNRTDYSKYTYENYIQPFLGRKKLSQIRRSDVSEMHTALGKGGKKRTANKAHTVIRAMLNKAIAWEYLEGANPAEHVQRFREQSRDRFMSKAEAERFQEALSQEPDDTIRDYFAILLYTGARKTETLKMRWDQIDFDAATWRIPDPKNGEPRLVSLAQVAMTILKRRQKLHDSTWVFPGRKRGHHLTEPKKAWERILERAEIDDLHIHDLRRTLGSWLRSAGADLQVIGKVLGHKDYQSSLIYSRLDVDVTRVPLERATKALAPRPKAVTRTT